MTAVLTAPVAHPPAAAPAAPSVPPPAATAAAAPERRRSVHGFRRSDVLALGGSAAGAVSLTAVLYTAVLPFSGALGFVLLSWAAFLGLYALVVSFDESGPAVRDRVAAVFMHSLAFVLLMALVLIVGFTLYRARRALSHLNFFTSDLSTAGPLDPLTAGGILHAATGTLIEIALALAITIPLGLTCALFLTEIPGAFSRTVRTIAEAMTALPSIVAGLFIYATLIQSRAIGKSGVAASLAISVMMLPIIIRASDVVIRLVPASLKEASLALGAGQWRTVWNVTLPTARSGLATAVILGTARGIGETSPVLLTAGYTTNLNLNALHGPMTSLPLTAFTLISSPQPNQIARGFGAAATLLVLVLALFVSARVVGGRGPGTLTRRQEHRRVLASRRDVARFEARPGGLSGPLLPGFSRSTP